MGHQDRGHYTRKHPGAQLNQALAQHILQTSSNGILLHVQVQMPIALQRHKIVCQRESGCRWIYLNCASHNANSVFLDTPQAKKKSILMQALHRN